MPPKKGKKKAAKKKQAGEDKPEKDPRDNPREYELHEELEKLIKERNEIKNRIQSLRSDNEWLEQEAQKITDESQEYMSFMAKKANQRQNSIITLTDQNRKEIEDIKKEKESLQKMFDANKKALQDRLIQKQSKLNSLREEIDRMSEFKDLKQHQLEEIETLKAEIVKARSLQTKLISDLRTKLVTEKNEHKRDSDMRIAAIVKTANREARECLNQNTFEIKVQNQQLRKELLDLINTTKDYNNHKEKLEVQKAELLKEIKYAEDLMKVRSTQQSKVIQKLSTLRQ